MPIAWRIALGTKVAGEQKSCQGPGKYRKKLLDFFGAPAFVSPSVSTTYARRGPKQVPCQVQVGTVRAGVITILFQACAKYSIE